MSLGLSAAAWGAIGSTAISAYSASRSSRAGGGGGGGGGGLDPFGQYRGQFGNQLSQLFGPKLDADGNPIKNADGTTQYNTPSWLTPGAGMNFGQDLHPGQGLPGMSDIPGAGTGMASNDMLKFDPAAIANDPAYQFQRRQGMEALDSGAAAAGELNSGGARAAAVQYGQGIASDFTNQQLQRNLARYQAQNQAQNQGFGQSMGVWRTDGLARSEFLASARLDGLPEPSARPAIQPRQSIRFVARNAWRREPESC